MERTDTDVATSARQLSRREVLRRSAVAGGAAVWMVPVVQRIGMSAAHAQVPSPVPTTQRPPDTGGTSSTTSSSTSSTSTSSTTSTTSPTTSSSSSTTSTSAPTTTSTSVPATTTSTVPVTGGTTSTTSEVSAGTTVPASVSGGGVTVPPRSVGVGASGGRVGGGGGSLPFTGAEALQLAALGSAAVVGGAALARSQRASRAGLEEPASAASDEELPPDS